jgi:hypothetical protein
LDLQLSKAGHCWSSLTGGFAILLHTTAKVVRAKVHLRRTAAAWLAGFCTILTAGKVGDGCFQAQGWVPCWSHSGHFSAWTTPDKIIPLMQALPTRTCYRSSDSWHIELCPSTSYPIRAHMPEIAVPSLQSSNGISSSSSCLLRIAQVAIVLKNAKTSR